ncbi:hypothetical protein [Komagataeibacter sp. FNDCF1]|uniref:hypothetical protein n=1 Tax=Komagataeibacter sp. FNDCF1 TaxID=2878681 RepID=UPI001E2C6844|nr:hypothetical protein [Komagataeibacter sp. FNDCF1]MCE2563630.1 hypothetical protein [Komagataeibacter sp. FNDCF1]
MHTPFTCANARYRTDTAQGHPHGAGHVRGSVLTAPLVTRPDTGDTLWLEYVAGPEGTMFWIMWYDANGQPRLTHSAVMDRVNLDIMLHRLGYDVALQNALDDPAIPAPTVSGMPHHEPDGIFPRMPRHGSG